ncbi:hypothetical protein EI42_04279 [Thermosporothrix hazakensis]|jgi:hypothetical protein|uniref:Uncharacterized protein n=2 Tax=Thermosporothrix TaxID=768650 RepID=A0A326UF98_THEHA|nr:DUF6062 family protein [Thermosporothrix hazakensis]PZW25435.1 hypothetical protein EI42_04279 [Thermosporothrix hazakensis]BBH90771.1 hypothetical protein KTC_55220 [Thermosporothrix sp. COM3]GCE48820.1 hypothetical protein KTH_36890 [Thermosporothrix hazakensis]
MYDYRELERACTQEGCPLCRLIAEGVTRYLESWKYEHFTDVEVREELRRSRGFCGQHTRQLVQMGAALPLAQSYHDIVTDTLEQLEQTNGSPGARGLLSRIFEKRTGRHLCPACHQEEKITARTIDTLRQALGNDEFYACFEASDGLCLDHFQEACTLRVAEISGHWLSRLRQAQLACLRRLEAELSEFIRKHDYRYQGEASGSEAGSWKKAAGLVAGWEQLQQKL